MTVNIPTSFSTTDITVGDGVASGQKITEQGLSTIVANHNFIGGNFRPSCADVMMANTGGFSTFAAPSTYYSLILIPVLGHADAKEMTFTGVFTNLDTDDCEVRLACGSNAGSAVTLSGSASGVTLTLTCDAETTDFVAAVQVYTPLQTTQSQVLLLCGSLCFSGLTGSQSSSPTSTGFVWGQSAELQDTYPLTVEQYNRFLNGPYTVWKGCPQSMGSLIFSTTFRMPDTTSTTYSEVGRMILTKRRPNVTVQFIALGLNGTLKISIEGTEYELVLSSGSTPSYNTSLTAITVNKFSEIDLSEQPGFLEVVFSWKSTSGSSAKLVAVNAMVKK